jgi:hypothetical protein
MKRRFVVGTMVMAAAMVAGSAVCAEAAMPTYTHGSIPKTQMVSFHLRNDSGAAIKLSVGSDVVTLAAGKTVKMKLEVGDKIVAEEATSTYPAGTVLSVVSTGLADATVVVK